MQLPLWLLSHIGPITMKTGLQHLRRPGGDLSGLCATVFLFL